MLNFDNFFGNHFDTKTISDDTLNLFTLEHLPLLAGFARFAPLVTATIAAHASYFGAVSDEATKAAIQKAFTRTMNDKLEELGKLLSQHEGAFRSKWGQGSPNYLRFLPQGLSEFRAATLGNIGEKVNRLKTAFADLGSELDPAVVAAFISPGDSADASKPKGVLVRFEAARQAQLDAKGETVTAKGASSGSRDALEKQLMVNLLTVALDAVPRSDAERAELRKLFPQHILTPNNSNGKGAKTNGAGGIPGSSNPLGGAGVAAK